MSISPQSENLNSYLVMPLTDFARGNLALAGGKGANLGELIRAGFDVPPGFVITTAAYDLLLQTNGLQAIIQDQLVSLQVANPESVDEFSRVIGDAIRDASIPHPVVDSTLQAYHQLGDGAVAVRSSATAEDLPEAAFAGQQ